MQRIDGSWLWVSSRGRAVSGADGQPVAPGEPGAETRFIVLGWGSRRRPRPEAVGSSGRASAMARIPIGMLIRKMRCQSPVCVSRPCALAKPLLRMRVINSEASNCFPSAVLIGGFTPEPASAR